MKLKRLIHIITVSECCEARVTKKNVKYEDVWLGERAVYTCTKCGRECRPFRFEVERKNDITEFMN